MAKKNAPALVPSTVLPSSLLGLVTHGDCLGQLPQLPAKSIDLVFCDPPFNIGYEYASHDDAMAADAYLAWCAQWISECERVLHPNGSFWIAISDEYVSELKVLTEGRFALHASKPPYSPFLRVGPKLKLRHHIIWYFTFGQNGAKKLTRSHTHLLHFVKSTENHVWHPESVRIPSARALIYNDKRANPAGRLPDDTWILRPQELPDGFQDAGHDVWTDHRVCGTYAEKQPTPNQMPERLLARIIRLSTDPGAVVLDPFAGSGTTPAVAKKLGRRFVAFEKDPGYAAGAAVRVLSAREGEMLDPPAQETTATP